MTCLRCELHGIAQDTQPSIGVFFHVAAMAETDRILAEQLGVIREARLMQWAQPAYATVAGADAARTRDYTCQLEAAGFREIANEPQLAAWEFPTLRAVWEHCLQIRSDKHFVLYLHTKGASKPGDPDAEWRRELTDFAVRHWRDRVRELDDGRLTSGPRYLNGGCGSSNAFVLAHAHYSGNVWWAASDYVTWLPDPDQFDEGRSNRFAAEAWLGQHPGINRLRSEVFG